MLNTNQVPPRTPAEQRQAYPTPSPIITELNTLIVGVDSMRRLRSVWGCRMPLHPTIGALCMDNDTWN